MFPCLFHSLTLLEFEFYQDFVGRFDVYQIIGNEEDYLTTHLQYISSMIKTKLGIVSTVSI